MVWGTVAATVLCGACATSARSAGRSSAAPPVSSAGGASRTLHYTANGVFSGSRFVPASLGFNVVDVESTWDATHLPAGTKGMVWLGLCDGADAAFVRAVTRYLGNAGVFGYYLFDDPDPSGRGESGCTPAHLKEESDWIHAHDSGRKTFVLLMNLAGSADPSYQGTANPANTGIDLYGLDPYPCRTELAGCAYSYITKAVGAAEAWGIPAAQLVPVFQTFGGGAWPDDGGGSYALPTAAQEMQILATWDSVLPHPVLDYAYSWGSQRGDTALSAAPSLQPVLARHNAAR